MGRRERGTGGQVAAIVRVAEDDLAGFDDVDRIGAAEGLVRSANRRLRDAVDESERLELREPLLLGGGGLLRQIDEPHFHHHAVAVRGQQRLHLQPRIRQRFRCLAVQQQHAVDRRGGSAPVPPLRRVVEVIAQDASPRRRRHAVEKGRWKRRERIGGEMEFAERRRGQREDDGAIAVRASVAERHLCLDLAEPFPPGHAVVSEGEADAAGVLQEAEAAEHQALNLVHLHR